MLTRLVDFLKVNGITALFTALTSDHRRPADVAEDGVSSLVDTWISVRNPENHGARARSLSILKSRGMSHSSQVREFVLTDDGVALLDGPGG